MNGEVRIGSDTDRWYSTLLFVAAAGGLALTFVGIGYWFAARRARALPAGAQPSTLALTDGFGAPPDAPPFKRLGDERTASPADPFVVIPTLVSTTPVPILRRASRKMGTRRVAISTDQPIRVAPGNPLDAARGFYIDSSRTLPVEMPFNVEIFAVRAGAQDANVAVSVTWI